ncbi:hypothetical protein EVAR_18756_1 [Eumeta japonica]|uniref:Uncharacterized protein n=1 Tax=Eumeta variegata TaxID=151549 RepID=A0A4C1UM90_EUMVA|nr:hypothetical protein EVAR_18756_1 [Eumeta japonica]
MIVERILYLRRLVIVNYNVQERLKFNRLEWRAEPESGSKALMKSLDSKNIYGIMCVIIGIGNNIARQPRTGFREHSKVCNEELEGRAALEERSRVRKLVRVKKKKSPSGDKVRLCRVRTFEVRIATGAVAHIGGSEGFAIGCRSRPNFPRNIGRRFLPYKAMNLFPGRVPGKCRVQPEPVARSLTHRPRMRYNRYTILLTKIFCLLFHLSVQACGGEKDNTRYRTELVQWDILNVVATTNLPMFTQP